MNYLKKRQLPEAFQSLRHLPFSLDLTRAVQWGNKERKSDGAEGTQKEKTKLLGTFNFGMGWPQVRSGEKPDISGGEDKEAKKVAKAPALKETKPFESCVSRRYLHYANCPPEDEQQIIQGEATLDHHSSLAFPRFSGMSNWDSPGSLAGICPWELLYPILYPLLPQDVKCPTSEMDVSIDQNIRETNVSMLGGILQEPA